MDEPTPEMGTASPARAADQSDEIRVDYREIAPAIVEQMARETVAGKLAATEVQLATQTAYAQHIERLLRDERRLRVRGEEVVAALERLVDALQDRLDGPERGTLDSIAHLAGVVLDGAKDRRLYLAGDGTDEIRELTGDVDVTDDELVLVRRMTLDRVADALRALDEIRNPDGADLEVQDRLDTDGERPTP